MPETTRSASVSSRNAADHLDEILAVELQRAGVTGTVSFRGTPDEVDAATRKLIEELRAKR